MKIVRFEDKDAACWGVVDAEASRVQPIAAPFASWAPQAAKGTIDPGLLTGYSLDLRSVDLLPPLDAGARVFAAGRNYGEHLRRLGADIPNSPTVFMMPASTIIADGATIAYPSTTRQLDYEIELVAVLALPLLPGRPATESLLGYTIGNDISARDAAALAGGRSDLFSQKSCDGTTPVGPWIVTSDELGGAGQPPLDFRLSVNGELRQQDSSRSMLFSVDRCLDYVDDRVRLAPGDLLFTGSTHGVGLESGRFLRPGDLIEATVDGIGTLRNRVGETVRETRFRPS